MNTDDTVRFGLLKLNNEVMKYNNETSVTISISHFFIMITEFTKGLTEWIEKVVQLGRSGRTGVRKVKVTPSHSHFYPLKRPPMHAPEGTQTSAKVLLRKLLHNIVMRKLRLMVVIRIVCANGPLNIFL